MIQRIFDVGVRRLFSGARQGQPLITGLGAALTVLAWLRKRRVDEELLFKRELKAGESLRIAFLRGEVVSDESGGVG